MRSGWKWSGSSRWARRKSRTEARAAEGGHQRGRVATLLVTLLFLGIVALPVAAQNGTPMTPERLTSLTQGRTMTLRSRASTLTQITPGVTQQMMYRIRLTPEAPDPALSVFCTNVRLNQFEHAMTALFGYRLVGRSQGEGMGLVFVPEAEAVAAAGRQRLQGRAAAEAGIARALAWIKQPQALDEIARTRCPAAGALREEGVKRAFALFAALPKAQRETVLAGHPVTVPYATLPAASRALLPAGKPAPKWLNFYLFDNPWNESGHPRLAVRAEPSGKTWLSCPPLALAPAHLAPTPEAEAAFKVKLKGAPDLEDLEAGEEAPAIMEWLAEEGHVAIMSEGLRPYEGGPDKLKRFGASFGGLSLEESLDRLATFFDATWRFDDGWVLFQRRSTESLTRNVGPTSTTVQVGRR
jgi:hypothetical protein